MKISFRLALATVLMLGGWARAQETPKAPLTSPILARLEALFAELSAPKDIWINSQNRGRAFVGFLREREEIEQFFERKLATEAFWKNRDDEGSTARSIRLIGQLRLGANYSPGNIRSPHVAPEKIVGLLAEHLTYRVDSRRVQAGISYLPLHFTPVANALIQIDGPQVRRAMLDKAESPIENERICAVYVLHQTLGEVTLPLLEAENRRRKARDFEPHLDAAFALFSDVKQKFSNFAYTGDAAKSRFSSVPLNAAPAPLPYVAPPIFLPDSTLFRNGIERPRPAANPFGPKTRGFWGR